MTDPHAPRLFRTRRGAVRWMEQHRPPHDSPELRQWLYTFWRDQADRGYRRAELLALLAVIASTISATLAVARLVWGVG